MNRTKLIDFLKTKEDDLDSEVYDYILGLLDDESGEVTDADIIDAVKKNNIDKLQGYNSIFSDDALSDVQTNISSDEYDAYVKMRSPSESSKQKYGQRTIEEKHQKAKDEVERRKRDIEQYETIGFDNPYVAESRNKRVSKELANYDVKSKIDEYTQNGLTKEAAIAKVREDIKNIGESKPNSIDKLKGAAFGLSRYLFAPAMYNDYYIESGNEDNAEALIRAGLGGGLNALELSPYGKGMARGAKVAIIAAKPTVEAIRQNIVDSDKANYKQTVVDAFGGTVKNSLLNSPAEMVSIAKNIGGAGKIIKKQPTANAIIEGIEESAKVGRSFAKEYKNEVDDLLKTMSIDSKTLKTPVGYEEILAQGLKDFARKPNNAHKVREVTERLKKLGFDSEANYILNIQTNPAQLVNGNIREFRLGSHFDKGLDPVATLNSRQKLATFAEENPLGLVMAKRTPDSDLLERAAEQLELSTLKHPKIANAAAKGYIGSGAKAVGNIVSNKDSKVNEVEQYIDNIKNDDLALRMWRAGFRPKNLTKRQIEYINEEISQ